MKTNGTDGIPEYAKSQSSAGQYKTARELNDAINYEYIEQKAND